MLKERNKRLDVLYRKHHQWLLAVARNTTSDEQHAEDLVGDLYVYLSEVKNPEKYYYNDSWNLKYCHSFITTRWINKVKKINRHSEYDDKWDTEDVPYNEEFDRKLMEAYQKVQDTLKEMKKTDKWSAAMITEMYFFNPNLTLEKISQEIGISRSTTFLNVKKTKKELKNRIDNPFKDEE